MTPIRLIPLLAALLVALVLPSGALASGKDVRDDCTQDGKLDRVYSPAEYREALAETPSNEDEYGGDCRNLIQAALNRGVGGGGGGAGGLGGGPGGFGGGGFGGGGFGGSAFDSLPDTPQEAAALDRASGGMRGNADMPPPELKVGGESVLPGIGIPAVASALNDLPLPEKLALISLASLLTAAGWLAVRRRFPGVRRVALRLVSR
ncbi:MAG: hypothetical protein ACR2NV_08545 [Thermoleophilaceae bacterium]